MILENPVLVFFVYLFCLFIMNSGDGICPWQNHTRN